MSHRGREGDRGGGVCVVVGVAGPHLAQDGGDARARGAAASNRSGVLVAVVDVKTAAIRAWVAKMVAEDVGVPGIENAFGLLRQVLGAAVEDRRIPRNPCEGVRLPKRKHADRGYLSHAQVAALAAAVDRHPEVVRFLAYTGLRWGEMAALRVQDFDMLRRRVNVSRSVTESGGLVWSHAEDVGTALGAVPAVARRRAGGADGRQGPRRAGVHRPARRGAA